MQIILLRHEKRNIDDATFDSPLTEDGKLTATTSLILELNKYNITHIYASPFTRCLETIEPFANSNGLKIRCDNGLYERVQSNSGFVESTYKRTVNDTFVNIVDLEYHSSKSLDSVRFNETVLDVQQRSKSFLNYILQAHSNNDILLIVTHLSVANAILNRNDDDFRLDMGNMECLSMNSKTDMPFDEWLKQASLQYQVSEDTHLKMQTSIKMLLNMVGKCSVNLVSVVCMLISSCITQLQYQRFCKWHVYITSTYTRVLRSPYFRRITSSIFTDLKTYANDCWKEMKNVNIKCNEKFGIIYKQEQDAYRVKN